MAAGNSAQTIKAKGRLIWNPQDEDNADGDWGGTVLGRTKAFAIQSRLISLKPTDAMRARVRCEVGTTTRSRNL